MKKMKNTNKINYTKVSVVKNGTEVESILKRNTGTQSCICKKEECPVVHTWLEVRETVESAIKENTIEKKSETK